MPQFGGATVYVASSFIAQRCHEDLGRFGVGVVSQQSHARNYLSKYITSLSMTIPVPLPPSEDALVLKLVPTFSASPSLSVSPTPNLIAGS